MQAETTNRSIKKPRNESVNVKRRKAAKYPPDEQAEEKLPPATPRILYDQSFGFSLLRILIGSFLGFLLRCLIRGM